MIKYFPKKIQKIFHLFAHSPFLYQFMGRCIPFFWVGALLFLGYGTYGGLILAPLDYQQKDAFRILYVHVPCAFFSLFIYAVIAFYSVLYLIWRVKIFDILSVACAPIGALFTFLALATGSIWGKPMWGTWWIWDARLTSELILFFLYCGYMGLYNAINNPKTAAKACAFLAIVGVIDIPIIHFSVTWWQTLHQGSTLMKSAPSLDPQMLWPLLGMLLGFGFYTGAVCFTRARSELLKRESDKRWVRKLGKLSL